MKTELLIIGAGVSGIMAYRNTSHLNPLLVESRDGLNKQPIGNHHAVMRLRSPVSATMLGCRIKAVEVKKAILYGGRLFDKCNITMNNLYSLKTSGEIVSKSIWAVEPCTRYEISSAIRIPDGVLFGHTLVRLFKRTAIFSTGEGHTQVEYKNAISTIPLPSLLSATGTKTDLKFESKPIYITRVNISESSEGIHQTIYLPEKEYSAYRATIENKTLIVEAVKPVSYKELNTIENLFGLSCRKKRDSNQFVMKFGKMKSVDDGKRKDLLYQLTDQHSIYSLGRFAVWKPLTIDKTIADFEKICVMMNSSSSKYAISKNRIKE